MVQLDATAAALQAAAKSIVEDRKRLNETYASIQAALKAYMPSVRLDDEGELITLGDIVERASKIIEEATELAEEAGYTIDRATPQPEIEDEPMVFVPVSAPQVTGWDSAAEDLVGLKEALAKSILEKGPTRPSFIDDSFLGLTLPHGTVVTIPFLNTAIQELRNEKVLKRLSSGWLQHRDYSPKVATSTAPNEGSGGSGTRKDVMPKPKPTPSEDRRVHMRHAYLSGDTPAPEALCGFKRANAIDTSAGDCPECVRLHAEDQVPKSSTQSSNSGTETGESPTGTASSTAESAQTPQASGQSSTSARATRTPLPTSTRSDTASTNLALSPTPRSEMKSQQREAEERLDKVVLWIIEKGDVFSPVEALKELGVRNKGLTTKTDHSYFKENGLFGNEGQAGGDFKKLEQRNIVLFSHYAHPAFKKDMENRGRTSPFYKRGPRFPKAEPAPPTKESVREPNPSQQAVASPPTAEAIRDAAVTWCKASPDSSVSIAQIIDRGGFLNTRPVRAIVAGTMSDFVRKGMFRNGDVMGSEWVYITPTDEGSAARLDRQRRPVEAVAGPARTGEGPSGRGLRVGNKEVQVIISAAVRKWGEGAVEMLAKHIKVKPPGKDAIIIAHTPNQRGLLRDKARLRKAGLVLA